MTWGVYELETFPPTVHVVPHDDLVEHELVDDCACGPSQTPVKRGDGVVGWLVSHASLDGREAEERARRLH